MAFLLFGTLYSAELRVSGHGIWGRRAKHIRKLSKRYAAASCRRHGSGHKCHTFLCSHFYLCANLITFSTRILFRPFARAHRRYSFKRAHNTLGHSLKNENCAPRVRGSRRSHEKRTTATHISVSLGFSFLVPFFSIFFFWFVVR